MKELLINKTSKTPSVSLEKGLIQFSGSSVPEDCRKFYRRVLKWINDYQVETGIKTIINFNFDYIDHTSSKIVVQILKKMDNLNSKGYPVFVNWYYEEGDEDMLDLGVYLKSITKLTFNFIENKQHVYETELYQAIL